MLKYCVETMFENKGEGLLQACISSLYTKISYIEGTLKGWLFSKGKANLIGFVLKIINGSWIF